LLPAAMALKVETTGVKKAHMKTADMLALAVLAGAFIVMGAIFATTVGAGAFQGISADGTRILTPWPTGFQRLLSGVVFSLGLILVVIGGAELFTGNNLIVMAWADRLVSTRLLLRNWGVVYVGNLIGAVATAVLVALSGQHTFSGGQIGLQALTIAQHKANLEFVEAFVLGILCNALVCMAVWLTYSARSVTDKVLAIVPPIAAFVAAGFEHSIANMYFIPVAILIRRMAGAEFWDGIGRSSADFPAVTLSGFLNNLIPVTLGNIVGGALLVGAVYWFVYLRPRRAS
jgi:formate/nitrite transporter